MADHRDAFGTARPIVASSILVGWESAPIGLCTGEHVVIIRGIASSGYHGAAFGERDFHAQFVAVAMEIVDASGHNFAFEILPGARTDAITGVNGRCSISCLSAQIGSPRLGARARRLCQLLALPI